MFFKKTLNIKIIQYYDRWYNKKKYVGKDTKCWRV